MVSDINQTDPKEMRTIFFRYSGFIEVLNDDIDDLIYEH